MAVGSLGASAPILIDGSLDVVIVDDRAAASDDMPPTAIESGAPPACAAPRRQALPETESYFIGDRGQLEDEDAPPVS